jgi:TonB family protein
MIISWMIAALVFTACIAVAAAAAEQFARATGRPTRWIWSIALAAGSLWPALIVLATLALPQLRVFSAILPALRVVPDGVLPLQNSTPAIAEVLSLVVLGLWVLASLLLTLRLTRAVTALRALRASAERRVLDGVPVLVTESVGPATIGLRRHEGIIPRTLLDLEEPLRRLVLRHEREHCAARDPWLLLGAGVAVVLFPWNAALWLIARRLHLALEMDCDARVLAGGAEPIRYGQLLLWVAQRGVAIPLAPMLASPPSHLERRIIAMRTRFARPSLLHLGAAATLLVLGVAGACSEGAPNGPLAQVSSPSKERSRVAVLPKKAEGPYREFQAEVPAQQIPGTGRLMYPTAMRQANREGEVLAQFVVDESGVPQLTTFKVLQSTDRAFTEAVHTALSTMRFKPAVVGGHAVKQLVELPFTFSLQRNQ